MVKNSKGTRKKSHKQFAPSYNVTCSITRDDTIELLEEHLSLMKQEGTVFKKESTNKVHRSRFTISNEETELVEHGKGGVKIAFKHVKFLLYDQTDPLSFILLYTAGLTSLKLTAENLEVFHRWTQTLHYFIFERNRPSLKYSTVSAPVKCVAGVPSRIMIHSLDSMQRDVDMSVTDHYSWKVQIVNTTNSKIMQVADELDREVFVFTMTTSGSFSLQTLLKDNESGTEHVLSESEIVIAPSHVDLSKCSLQYEEEPVVAGSEILIHIIARDIYDNIRPVDASLFVVTCRESEIPDMQVVNEGFNCYARMKLYKTGNYSIEVHSIQGNLLIGAVTLTVVPCGSIDYFRSYVVLGSSEIHSQNPFNLSLGLVDLYGNMITELDRYNRQFLVRVRGSEDHFAGRDLYSANEISPTLFEVTVFWSGEYSIAVLLRGDDETNEMMGTEITVVPNGDEDERRCEYLTKQLLMERTKLETRLEAEIHSWTYGKRLPSLINAIIPRFAPHLKHLIVDDKCSKDVVLSVYKKILPHVHPDHILSRYATDSEEVLTCNIVFNTLQEAYKRYKGK